MEKMRAADGREETIIVKNGLIDSIGSYISGKRLFLVTDETVYGHYGERIKAALSDRDIEIYVIPGGEDSKTMETATAILEAMLEKNLSRSDELVAFGGGVVGDVAGFCAAIYMRGIPYYQVPTTLLAQVDSSVGGKTAVNMPQGKNLVGAFYQPKRVLIDPGLLKSLPERERVSGIGEVVKYGVILDYDFLRSLESNLAKLQSMEPDYLEYVIRRCVALKQSVTDQDERESGLRKILNFGHTVGHGIEKIFGYGTYSHGEAVLWGMAVESAVALEQGLIEPMYYEEIFELIQRCTSHSMPEFSVEALMKPLLHDKKNKAGAISFILPVGKGSVKEFLFEPAVIEPILERSRRRL